MLIRILFFIIFSLSFNALSFCADNSTSSQNVGIGSQYPGQRLDVIGTVRAIQFIGDGSALTGVSGGGTVADPTGTVGLSAVNGSASSAIRSDGAPALSQAITPTWTGIHTFSNATNSALFTGGNVGIGSLSPGAPLDVQGKMRSTAFQMSTSPTAGYLLQSDSVGNGSWVSQVGTVGVGTVNTGSLNQVAYYATTGIVLSPATNLSTDGTNVGVGTLNPTNKFCVGSTCSFGTNGSTTLQTAANTTTAAFTITGNSLTSGNALSVSGSSASETGSLVSFNESNASSSGAALSVTTNGSGPGFKVFDVSSPDTTPFLVDSAGNVGIGTALPQGQLDIRFQTPTPPILIGSSATDATGAFLKMDTNGNVGVGTITPGTKLDVTGTMRSSAISGQAVGTILCAKADGSIGYCSVSVVGVVCTCN